MNSYIICCTGLAIAKRKELEGKVTALGMNWSPNLTADVTHLIAETTTATTEKYKVAINMKIPIVIPAWIDHCSVQNIPDIEDWLLPPLQNCLICVSGFPLETRTRVQDYTEKLGGTYSPDLTKACTHLISLTAEGRKHEFAVKWGLSIVGLDWINDCFEKKGRMEESYYPISNGSTNQPSQLASQVMATLPVESNGRSSSTLSITTVVNPYLFKDCFICFGVAFKKLPTELDVLMNLVKKFGGIVMKDHNHLVTHYVLPEKQITQEDMEIYKSTPSTSHIIHSSWLRSCHQTNKLLTPTEEYTIKIPKPKQPLPLSRKTSVNIKKNASTTLSQFGILGPMYKSNERANSFSMGGVLDFKSLQRVNSEGCGNSRAGFVDKKVRVVPIGDLFSGMKFSCLGFKKNEVELLDKEISKLGGEFTGNHVSKPSTETIHVVVCFRTGTKYIPLTNEITVTEIWIEACIEDSKLHPHSAHPTYTPLSIRLPIPNFSVFSFSISGFAPRERVNLQRLCTLLGSSASESFSKKKTSHLICEKGTHEGSAKYRKARQWGIPVVVSDWIYRCADTGRVEEVEEYVEENVLRRTSIKFETGDALSSLNNITVKERYELSPSISSLAESFTANLSKGLKNIVSVPREHTELKQLLDSTMEEVKEKERMEREASTVKYQPQQQQQVPMLVQKRSFDSVLVYDDPQELVAKRKLLEHDNKLPPIVLPPDPKPAQKPVRIMMSGILAKEKPGLQDIIKKLGGETLATDGWDRNCTHLICSKPSKNEKCLAACASGIWVLKKSFLEESNKAGKFLNEEDFEWNSGDIKGSMTDKSKWLVDSGKRWRLKINESKAKGKAIGPFHDWKVILLVDPSRKMGFTRVLMAGGAEVLTLSEFDDISGKEITHCFAEHANTTTGKKIAGDLKKIKEEGIDILETSFVSDTLQREVLASFESYKIDC